MQDDNERKEKEKQENKVLYNTTFGPIETEEIQQFLKKKKSID